MQFSATRISRIASSFILLEMSVFGALYGEAELSIGDNMRHFTGHDNDGSLLQKAMPRPMSRRNKRGIIGDDECHDAQCCELLSALPDGGDRASPPAINLHRPGFLMRVPHAGR